MAQRHPDVAASFGTTNQNAVAPDADEARLQKRIDAKDETDVDEGQLRTAE